MNTVLKLGPNDYRTLRGMDKEEWRTAREISRRSGYPRWQAPWSLRRLRDNGLVEAKRREDDILLYRLL